MRRRHRHIRPSGPAARVPAFVPETALNLQVPADVINPEAPAKRPRGVQQSCGGPLFLQAPAIGRRGWRGA